PGLPARRRRRPVRARPALLLLRLCGRVRIDGGSCHRVRRPPARALHRPGPHRAGSLPGPLAARHRGGDARRLRRRLGVPGRLRVGRGRRTCRRHRKEQFLMTTATTPTELDATVQAAHAAYQQARDVAPARRADWLRAVADTLDGAADDLVGLAGEETHLPDGRLRGELTRTTFQLRLLADEVAAGHHLEA